MTINHQSFRLRELLWEIPLAFLSFLFYKVMKVLLGIVFNIYLSLNKQQAFQWRVLSAQTLKNPIALPVLMTKGSRWNTHAIIATVGSFAVKQSVALQVESAEKSAQSWTIVVYSYPDYKTVTSVGSLDSPFDHKWEPLKLNSGKYTLGLRYYNWSNKVEIPAVKVDEMEVVNSKAVPTEVNDFYRDLNQKNSFFYFCLHYYIFTLLNLRRWLPESFVKREYLPVGNPETSFFYGPVRKKEALQIQLQPLILEKYDVYFTLYNRASFPVNWYQIKEANYITSRSEKDGFYLIRIHKKIPIPEQFISEWVKIINC